MGARAHRRDTRRRFHAWLHARRCARRCMHNAYSNFFAARRKLTSQSKNKKKTVHESVAQCVWIWLLHNYESGSYDADACCMLHAHCIQCECEHLVQTTESHRCERINVYSVKWHGNFGDPTGKSKIHSRLNLISRILHFSAPFHGSHGNNNNNNASPLQFCSGSKFHHIVWFGCAQPTAPHEYTLSSLFWYSPKFEFTAALNAILIAREPFQNSLLCVMRQVFSIEARNFNFFLFSRSFHETTKKYFSQWNIRKYTATDSRGRCLRGRRVRGFSIFFLLKLWESEKMEKQTIDATFGKFVGSHDDAWCGNMPARRNY